jgi:DNA helicase-2/ATP-dependent DNA helicase PcrA
MNDMLSNLNPAQKEAVEAAANGGAVLVLSGAGTGKTTVLTKCIAQILVRTGIPQWQILAATFTNKAAREMKQRISESPGSSLDWAGTFHSICLKILRREKRAAGGKSDFLVFGEDEQKAVLKTVFTQLNLSRDDYDPANWVEKISFYKDTGQKNGHERFNDILNAYNAELARLNAVDFADIINHANNLLIENPAVLQKYQNQFRYILVDEFQDTNAPQYAFLRMLAAGCGNICAVGDDDQSIYSWRGAQIKNILNLDRKSVV